METHAKARVAKANQRVHEIDTRISARDAEMNELLQATHAQTQDSASLQWSASLASRGRQARERDLTVREERAELLRGEELEMHEARRATRMAEKAEARLEAEAMRRRDKIEQEQNDEAAQRVGRKRSKSDEEYER